MLHKWRRSAGGWWAEVHEPSAAPEQFGDFCRLVATWQTKRRENTVPSWSAFDIPDFRGWYGRLLMVERPADEGVVKLFGSELIPLFGRDLSRRPLEDGFGSRYRQQAELLRGHLTSVTANKAIGTCEINFTFAGKSYVRAAVLTLPLVSRATGADLALSVVEPRVVWPT